MEQLAGEVALYKTGRLLVEPSEADIALSLARIHARTVAFVKQVASAHINVRDQIDRCIVPPRPNDGGMGRDDRRLGAMLGDLAHATEQAAVQARRDARAAAHAPTKRAGDHLEAGVRIVIETYKIPAERFDNILAHCFRAADPDPDALGKHRERVRKRVRKKPPSR